MGNTPPPRPCFGVVALDEVVPVKMATNIVVGVSCAHIGLGLPYLLGVGDGREEESRDMKNPFMGDLIAPRHANVCCVGFVLEQAEEYLSLFDEDLFVLVSLVSFLGKAWLHCRPKISFTHYEYLFVHAYQSTNVKSSKTLQPL
jgi:hypothetical protein